MKSSEALRCRILAMAMLLTLAFTVNWSLQSRFSFLQTCFVPERLRSFVAAYLWSKADDLMHRGPVDNRLQSFQAGSYAGNTDIVPLLRLVIAIMPEETSPYQLLANNLSKHLSLRDEGLRVLQQGIISNPEHPAVHELYAAAAFLYVFAADRPSDSTLHAALKYLAAAIGHYNPTADKFSSDPAFTVANYYILSARLHLELKQPDRALQSWLKSGQDIEKATDQLAVALRKYRDHRR